MVGLEYRRLNAVEALAFQEVDDRVYPPELREHFQIWRGIVDEEAKVRLDMAGETFEFDEHRVIRRSTKIVDFLTRWMRQNHDWPWSSEFSVTVDNIARELRFVERGEPWVKAILPVVVTELLRLRWLHQHKMGRDLGVNTYAMAAEVAAHILSMKNPGKLAEVYRTTVPAVMANFIIGG